MRIQVPEPLQASSWHVKQHHLQGKSGKPAPQETEQQPTEAAPEVDQQQQPRMAPETQAVSSGQMFAALANVGNFADMYPDSQAQAQPAEQVLAPAPMPAVPEEAPAEEDRPAAPEVGGSVLQSNRVSCNDVESQAVTLQASCHPFFPCQG